MNTTTLQMQTVLFHNDVSHLMRSLEYLANALEVARRQGWDITLRVVYGDASSQPLFTPEQVAATQEKYRDAFTFTYEFLTRCRALTRRLFSCTATTWTFPGGFV